MTATATNPFTRSDTMLGICQAVGEDFGFHPNFLRVAFALGLFWSAGWTIAAYLGLGVAVLASRLIFPARVKAVAAGPVQVASDNDAEAIEYAKAA